MIPKMLIEPKPMVAGNLAADPLGRDRQKLPTEKPPTQTTSGEVNGPAPGMPEDNDSME